MTDEQLNGTPQEFPHREEAKNIYRNLWLRWLVSRDSEEKEILEREMDTEQLRISKGPGSVWREFAASLPGYNAWWKRETESMKQEVLRRLQP